MEKFACRIELNVINKELIHRRRVKLLLVTESAQSPSNFPIKMVTCLILSQLNCYFLSKWM